jgi:hypothetical protein
MLTAVAIVLLSDASASGPADLWIGVVSFRVPANSIGPGSSTALDPSTILEPVGALVGGKWWFDSRTDQTVTDALLESVGKVPAQWLPPGTDLPSRWRAHLFGERQVALRTVGPLDIVYESQDLFVASDLKLPRGARSTEGDFGAQGIAVAGDVQVQFFTDLDASRHPELLRLFSARMLAAERAEIQRKAAGVFPNDADIKLLMSQLASTPRHTNLAKIASQLGSPVYVIEGAKTFKIRDVVATLFTGAGARRSSNGALHLLGTWSYLDANEWAHENRPLAVVERNGRSCWLIAHAQEGGQAYSLTRPGRIAPVEFTSTCDIK